MVQILLPLFGVVFLIFRIWICEVRLKDLLDFRRHFLSRFASYYFCIALILDLRNEIFNFIVLGSIPILTIAFLTFDIPFFVKFHKDPGVDEESKFWLYIERIMLHPPILIMGYIVYAFHPRILIPSIQFPSVLIAVIIVFTTYIIFDDRALKIEGTGIWLIIGMAGSLVGVVTYLVL